MFYKYYFAADCLGQNRILKSGYSNFFAQAEFRTGLKLSLELGLNYGRVSRGFVRLQVQFRTVFDFV